MSMQVEKLDHNMADITIEVDSDKFEKALNEAFNRQKNKISVPGFRKGKVPRQMIEKLYGPEIFYEEAADICIRETYEHELDSNKDIEVVSRAKIDVKQCEKGKSFIYVANVALKPPVKLGKYKGVKIDKIDTEVTDDDINAEIETERKANARTINVTDRAVKDGDMTVIDFEGFVDGEPFEGGKSENYPLKIGSGQFIPGFEEQLIGAEIGKEIEVNVTFPDEYQAEHLAGKPAVFKCLVHEIKESELPDVDDEFASEVSEFDTLAEYKEDLKKTIAERKAKQAKDEREIKAVEAAVENAEMDIPDQMVEYETEQMVNDYAMRLRSQGLTIEQYFAFSGQDKNSMKEEMKPSALKSIKSRLVLEAVAEAEKIEATDEDIEKELERMSEMYGLEADKLKSTMGDKEKEMLTKDVILRKASEFVASQAVT